MSGSTHDLLLGMGSVDAILYTKSNNVQTVSNFIKRNLKCSELCDHGVHIKVDGNTLLWKIEVTSEVTRQTSVYLTNVSIILNELMLYSNGKFSDINFAPKYLKLKFSESHLIYKVTKTAVTCKWWLQF